MKFEHTINEASVAADILTVEQTSQVAGGLVATVYRPTGCLGCTSGGFLAFQNLVDVVNPAPTVAPMAVG
jgi:hypothetical protein